MKVARLKAERRTAKGRNQVNQLRKQGWTPAIVYGESAQPEMISVSEWEIEQHVKAHHKVFALDVNGQRQDAYLQEIAWDALTDRPQHIDFKRIDLTKPIEIEVEVAFEGHPIGLGKGGVLMKDHQVIRIKCLPTAIPESIEAKISHLDMDQSLTAKEVPMPEGVTLASPPDMVVCHVAKFVAQEIAAPAAAAPAEGAAPAAEGAAAAKPADAKDAKAGDKPAKG
ncbi:MAG: 50S ribosomal protein L25 [Planctomycetes bacterium]|nr:50S ribosomal protein L25 [Planctomycetota bacterium]